jgi:hypothetical protein
MKRLTPPSPAALKLVSLGIAQTTIAEAVGMARRGIGYQLDGVYRMRPETIIAIRAIDGPETAAEVERLAYESWVKLHPKKAQAQAEVSA